MDGAVLKYVELKSGFADNGPAWIGHVKASKSGRTIYFNGMALKRLRGQGIKGNHWNLETHDEYWVSGIKKDGQDRHWVGSGKIMIEAAAVEEYLRTVDQTELDSSRFTVVHDIRPTEPSDFVDTENQPFATERSEARRRRREEEG